MGTLSKKIARDYEVDALVRQRNELQQTCADLMRCQKNNEKIIAALRMDLVMADAQKNTWQNEAYLQGKNYLAAEALIKTLTTEANELRQKLNFAHDMTRLPPDIAPVRACDKKQPNIPPPLCGCGFHMSWMPDGFWTCSKCVRDGKHPSVLCNHCGKSMYLRKLGKEYFFLCCHCQRTKRMDGTITSKYGGVNNIITKQSAGRMQSSPPCLLYKNVTASKLIGNKEARELAQRVIRNARDGGADLPVCIQDCREWARKNHKSFQKTFSTALKGLI